MPGSGEVLLRRVREATAGDYLVEREIGRGGMAAVYLARDTVLRRRVAIKVVLPDLVNDAEIQDRFLIEAQATAHLDHPGIVTVYSVRKRADLAFIVMKYIDGRALDDILADHGTMDPVVVAAIVTQVAEALQFAHAEGVIHRDVKPSNILVDRRGRAYVTDFGIAKLSSAQDITLTGTVIGTPIYMSPEQCRGLAATAASDQYALGVTAFQLLTGRLPFNGNLFELIHAHAYEDAPAPREINPTIQRSVERCVLRMLSKRPQDRWPSLANVVTVFAKRARTATDEAELRRRIAALAGRPAPARDSDAAVADELAGADTELMTTPHAVLVISPADPSIEVGETVSLRLSEASGASLAGTAIVWRSEDASIASVDDDGLVTGLAAGVAKITGSARQGFGRATLRVTEARVNAVVVTPQQPGLKVDSEQRLVATVLDPRGNVLAGRPVVWTSNNVGVCSVSQTGRVIAVAPGEATVSALCGDVAGTTTVRVEAAETPAVAPELAIRAPLEPEVALLAADAAGPGAAVAPRRRYRSTAAVAAVTLVIGSYLVLKQLGASSPQPAADLHPPVQDPPSAVQPFGSPVATGDSSRLSTRPPGPVGRDAGGAGRRTKDGESRKDVGTPDTANAIVPPALDRGMGAPAPALPAAPKAAQSASDASPGPARSTDSDRALRCSDSAAASSALSASLGANLLDDLADLYHPRDTTDAQAKSELLTLVRDAASPGTGAGVDLTPRVLRPDIAGTRCVWVAALDLTWTNAFGQPRARSPHIMMELEAVGGHAAVRRLFGATGVR